MKIRIAATLFGALTAVTAFAQQADTVVLPMEFHGTSEPMYILALSQPPSALAGLVPATEMVQKHGPLITEYESTPVAPSAAPSAFVQAAVNPALATPYQNFEGPGVGLGGFVMTGAPPDTTLAVGPNHVVAWVNSMYAVYDKAGNLLSPPLNGNTPFTGVPKLKFVAESKSANDYQKVGVRGDEYARTGTSTRGPSTTSSLSSPTSTGSTSRISSSSTDPRASMNTRARIDTDTNASTPTPMSMPMPSMSTAPNATATGAAAPPATIQILNGPNAGKELMLSKALTTLGRPGVQVAVITRRPQGYYITHVEGASFPVVNGKALGLDATALTNHDIIELSGTKMEFFFR